MATYRKALPEERRYYLDFANLVFSMAHCPHDFSKLLPKVYGEGRDTAHLQNIALDDEGHIRGLVAVLPGELHMAGETIKTGYLGTVSVHPYARGEGHMKHLMKMALDGAKADGLDIVMLGGQRQRYEYFGFAGGGVVHRYGLTKTNLRHVMKDVDVSDFSFVPMRGTDEALIDKAHALHEAQNVYAERSREDFVVILESWVAAPYIILKDGEFAGYLVASEDRKGISEIKLLDTDFYARAFKAWIHSQNLDGVRISVPAFDLPLNRVLCAMAEDWNMDKEEQLYVINFPRVISALLKLQASVRPLADGRISLKIDGSPLTIEVKDGEVSVTEEAADDAVCLTFMQAQEMMFSPTACFMGYSAPAGWFPLPLYMYSADHF